MKPGAIQMHIVPLLVLTVVLGAGAATSCRATAKGSGVAVSAAGSSESSDEGAPSPALVCEGAAYTPERLSLYISTTVDDSSTARSTPWSSHATLLQNSSTLLSE